MDGDLVGALEGESVVGEIVGTSDGLIEGEPDGETLGDLVGTSDGLTEGEPEGNTEGAE